MVLNGFGSNRGIWVKFWEDFNGNKLFIDVVVSRVLDAMTRMDLSCLLNSLHIYARECSGIEVPAAVFVFAFESIMISVDSVWNKFINIKKSCMSASMFQSWKTLKLQVDCKLRELVFQNVFHRCTEDLKITMDRLYTSIRMRLLDKEWLRKKKRGKKSWSFKAGNLSIMGKSAISKNWGGNL